MCSGISWLLRSRSLAIGLTSASTKARTERRISSCSGLTSGIVRYSSGGIAFANQNGALVFEHVGAVLIEAGGAKLGVAAVRARGIALGEHQRLRGDRIAGID